jgi:hypothetical protein
MDNQIQGQTTITADDSPSHEQLNMLDAMNFAIPEIEKLRNNLVLQREQLESELLQSEDYAQAFTAAKEANEKKRAAKMRVMSNPICAEIADKISGLQSDLKMQKSVLSEVVVRYADKTGNTSVHAPDGTTLKIVRMAKLVKEKKERRKKR